MKFAVRKFAGIQFNLVENFCVRTITGRARNYRMFHARTPVIFSARRLGVRDISELNTHTHMCAREQNILSSVRRNQHFTKAKVSAWIRYIQCYIARGQRRARYFRSRRRSVKSWGEEEARFAASILNDTIIEAERDPSLRAVDSDALYIRASPSTRFLFFSLSLSHPLLTDEGITDAKPRVCIADW